MLDRVVETVLVHHPKGQFKKADVPVKPKKPVTKKYRILDLFCCAGGAAKGSTKDAGRDEFRNRTLNSGTQNSIEIFSVTPRI